MALRDPLSPDELDLPDTGNRFDSPLGTFRVRYFGTTKDACSGETLARFRPDPAVVAEIGREWTGLGFMEIGSVPADWRQRRLAVQVRFPQGFPFLDIEAAGTRQVLRKELAPTLAYYEHDDLDVPLVRGRDRRITWISQWAYDQAHDDGTPKFAGIRYLSRLNTQWECWAVYEDIELEEIVREPISLNDPDLQRVADLFELKVF